MSEPSAKLKINGEIREFSNYLELKSYLRRERDRWSLLTVTNNLFAPEIEGLLTHLILDKLATVEIDTDLRGSSASDIVIGQLDDYIESDSVDGRLILSTYNKYGAVTAALLLAYTNKGNRNLLARGDLSFTRLLANPALAYEQNVAIQLSLRNEHLEEFIGNAYAESLNDMINRGKDAVKKTDSFLAARETQLNSLIESSKKNIQTEAIGFRRALKRRAGIYKRFAAQTNETAKTSLERANEALTDAVSTLESAKTAYHDRVDFEASVNYWTKRKNSHSVFKGLWFVAILICMIAMLSSVIGYYGFGGATGITAYVKQEALQVDTPQAPDIEQEQHTANSTSNSNSNSNSNSTATASGQSAATVMGYKASDLSIAVADLVGAALLVALMSVLLKIALRQFNTHSFCALDAFERITFTKTYLALLNEGKLKSDEDRRLILESLFRSSQSGGFADTSFSSPVELVLKALSERKISS